MIGIHPHDDDETALRKIKEYAKKGTKDICYMFGWDFDENTREPLLPIVIFSKKKMEEQGKMLMAHIMVDLNIFPSVKQAKKNGWDKPIEIGEFSVTKKKIRFGVIE